MLSQISFHQCLIFSNYQIRAKNLSETLAKIGFPSTHISGGQGQNERLDAMRKLKQLKCRILISTGLMSRGIDAERVNLVINTDLPRDSETYLHRVGRAGRYGSYGVAINFVAAGKEESSLKDIEIKCGINFDPLPDGLSCFIPDHTSVGWLTAFSLLTGVMEDLELALSLQLLSQVFVIQANW
ncbi:probable ATP-dependent RNA helicase DDX20 [Xenia sp. Carnegie-2017]|nr:probable ATP-dependent RNA helicase DDX20 [Xenia sp. Carnegie-2017]